MRVKIKNVRCDKHDRKPLRMTWNFDAYRCKHGLRDSSTHFRNTSATLLHRSRFSNTAPLKRKILPWLSLTDSCPSNGCTLLEHLMYVCGTWYFLLWGQELRSYISVYIQDQMINLKLAISYGVSSAQTICQKQRILLTLLNASTGPPCQIHQTASTSSSEVRSHRCMCSQVA